MKITLIVLTAFLLAGCTTDRFALVDRQTGAEFGPFLYRTSSNLKIGDKTYRIKRLVGRDAFLLDRMKSMIIPEVDFRGAHIVDIVNFLSEREIIMDHDEYMTNPRVEPRLVLSNEAQQKVPLITYSARYTSLYDTLVAVAKLADLDLTIQSGQVLLKDRP